MCNLETSFQTRSIDWLGNTVRKKNRNRCILGTPFPITLHLCKTSIRIKQHSTGRWVWFNKNASVVLWLLVQPPGKHNHSSFQIRTERTTTVSVMGFRVQPQRCQKLKSVFASFLHKYHTGISENQLQS